MPNSLVFGFVDWAGAGWAERTGRAGGEEGGKAAGKGGKGRMGGNGRMGKQQRDGPDQRFHFLPPPASPVPSCLSRPSRPSSLSCPLFSDDSAPSHGLHRQDLVQPRLVEQAAFQHDGADRLAALHRFLRDVRRRRVAKIRAERSGGGRAAIEQLARTRLVARDPVNAAQTEHLQRLAQDPGRVQRVPRDDRHHHVELELTGLGRDGHRRVASHHLEADLVHHFRHRRVDLARHDRRAGLHGRQRDFREPRTRSHAEQPQVARNLRDFHRETSHRTRVRQHVAHALRHPEQVDRGLQRQVRVAGEIRDHRAPVLVAGVEARAHGRRPDIQLAQLRRCGREIAGAAADARGVAAELLAERDRHGVLQVRAAGLQHVREFVRLARQAHGNGFRCRDKRRLAEQQRETRGRRIDVVGRLAHVDVIVRVNAFVRAPGFTEDLAGAVGQHLVGVHVVRRARARLIHVDDELIAEAAGEDLVGSRADGGRDVGLETSQRGVGFRCGFLDEDCRDDEIVGSAKAADGKVLHRARGLHAVVGSVGNLERAQRIGFAPKALSHPRSALSP